MKKYICLIVHTERIHDEKIWKRVQKLLIFLKKFNIRASWFSINPTFVGYQAMGFDEEKWKERLKFLSQQNQIIEQHTHFYRNEKGLPKGKDYDLSLEYVLKRIREDREWLEKQGFEIKGFISGKWKINEEILKILAREGYKYDLSINNIHLKQKISITKINGMLEIPATCRIKDLFLDFLCLRWKRRSLKYQEMVLCPLHFHDYDLNIKNYWLLIILILVSFVFNFKFITVKEFYENCLSYANISS